MDVQTENMDPPPCDSQSSGKIRKGFKLFGKRKPGNIFSIRSKGDGNNKSPVNRSKTLDGLSENAAPDSEQEPDKEKGQEVSQGEMEQAEEETLGEDGVLAAAHARTSISSASSAKSLSFLSLLRGGRRGTGDRRVHTVSQPVGRQRRGLKGLFGNVKFRSKDKDDKEEAPPSPLLMSSRANSVEIIKEDLTLTPKSQPRSLDSPETESCEPIKSLTTQDSAATTPSENVTPPVTAGHVSRTNEHVSPLPTPELPLVPGDNSLSSLLADISSLLTFDSISGGGDIMADVEAEWGKASTAISAVVTEVTSSSTSLFSRPSVSSPLTSMSVSTAATVKPSPVAVPTTASTKSFTPSSSSPIAKPSTIITTLTKSSTLTTHSVKLSSDSTQASEPIASIKIKSSPAPAVGKPSTAPATITSLSSTTMSSPSMAIKSTLSSTSTTNTAPPNTPATAVKAPSISPILNSTVSKLASEIASSPQMIPPVNKSGPAATPPPAPAKPPPVTHSPPTPVSFTQPPPAKLDSASNLNLQTSTSYKPPQSSTAGEPKALVTEPLVCAVTTKPPSPAPVIKTTAVPISTITSASVSVALSKPMVTASPSGLDQAPPSLVAAPHLCTSLISTTTTKTQPSPAPVPAPSSASLDKILPVTKPAPAPVSTDKMPPASTTTAAPTTAVVSTASSTPPATGQIPVSQSKTPSAPAEIPISLSKDPPAQMSGFQSKAPPTPAQIPVSVTKTPPGPPQIPISVTKDSPVPAQIPDSVSKSVPSPAQIPISVSKDPSASAQTQVSVSKEPPVQAQIPVSVSKDAPTPAHIPVSSSKTPHAPAQIPVSLPKDSPAPAHIPVSQSKTPPAPTSAPALCTVTSLPTTPAPLVNETQASAKMRGGGQASVDGQLASLGSTGAQGAQTMLFKTDELQNESRTSLQGASREKRTPQVKASGLSKIPVVGGGRGGKLPVRESQHADDEASRDPPTPVLEEERPHFNSHDAGSKDKISDVVPTSKHTQEESQQPPQPKVLTSLPRDSKIPVKHGAQPHTASQIPQAKDPPRTKIPVSKVPVRRVGNKPAAVGGSTQIRK